ncbi:IGR domain-containing protein [Mycena indigotica]|uniref:Small ribosomal subunit protein mS41 n=1 Tax=Mycena indigotica TaxID=2126181 RepID=A0A8H6SG05_9AGAR|nr:IGR domain-containing protein [Mycena indigotica]KAF7298873.1 IGR domain-containing protein [Mycena indigotica]
MNVLWQTLRPHAGPSTRLTRALATITRPVPNPTTTISTPESFLKAIGRSAETKMKNAEELGWEGFWQTSGASLKAAGVSVRDRRYILWCMEKFRSGEQVEVFAHEPPPKKKVRGWGPTVQNGKRIRSRRDRNNPPELKEKLTEKEAKEKKEKKKAKREAFRLWRDGII